MVGVFKNQGQSIQNTKVGLSGCQGLRDESLYCGMRNCFSMKYCPQTAARHARLTSQCIRIFSWPFCSPSFGLSGLFSVGQPFFKVWLVWVSEGTSVWHTQCKCIIVMVLKCSQTICQMGLFFCVVSQRELSFESAPSVSFGEVLFKSCFDWVSCYSDATIYYMMFMFLQQLFSEAALFVYVTSMSFV